jgi:hypothetical protein
MTTRSKIRLGVVLAVAALAAGACVITVWWEGTESQISFTWTINGESPATACAAAGATRVRLSVSQSLPSCNLSSASCGTWHSSWEWACNSGAGATGFQFAATRLYVGWTLLNAAGNVISYTTPWQDYTLAVGDNALGNVAFVTSAPTADAAIVSTWTIDDAAASAASCAAAGAATVYLTYRKGSTGTPQQMYWPCDSPSGTTGAILYSGRAYDLRWDLRAADGTILSAAPGTDTWQSMTAVAGNNPFTVGFVTAEPDPDAAVVTTWTIAGSAAGADTCGAANAGRVYLTYRPAGGTEQQMYWDCDSPSGTTGTLLHSGHAYELRWELRAADNTTVLSAAPGPTDWQALAAVAGNNPFTVNFPVAVGRLDVTLQWADKVVAPAWGDCAFPPTDVAVMGYLLETSTGTVVDQVDITTSPVACTTALAWVGAPFGGYTLEIDGAAASPGTTRWASECIGLNVDGLLDNSFNCQVPMTVP